MEGAQLGTVSLDDLAATLRCLEGGLRVQVIAEHLCVPHAQGPTDEDLVQFLGTTVCKHEDMKLRLHNALEKRAQGLPPGEEDADKELLSVLLPLLSRQAQV